MAKPSQPGGPAGEWSGEQRSAALSVADRAHRRHGDRAANVEWAREVLEAVGLIPTIRQWRISARTTTRRQFQHGRCSVCRLVKNLRVDGTVTNHPGADDGPCDGGLKPPMDEQTETGEPAHLDAAPPARSDA